VALAESDIGTQFTGADYDALLRILQKAGQGDIPMAAATQVLNWVDRGLVRPLQIKNEKMRWEAIEKAQVVRTGDGGFEETIDYSNPSGHRIAVGGDWFDNAYDPYPDIIDMVEFLRGKGYTVSNIIAGTRVVNALLSNANMKERVGIVSVQLGTVINLPGRLSREALSSIMAGDNLPPITIYDAQYRDQAGTNYYLSRNAMVFLCTTGRDEAIDFGDENPLVLQNTLGYLGVGRPVGQQDSGRVVKVRVEDDSKPPRIEGEAWQTSLPVILEPEAIGVLKDIDPAP
jgi:hypothetical protein